MSEEAHAMLQESLKKIRDERYGRFSIELDCPPGYPRPHDLIDGVLKDTGLEVEDFETDSPFFGHQTWILKESARKDCIFTKSKHLFKERIEKLFYSGAIRYGTW
jgi:hypothetical protein